MGSNPSKFQGCERCPVEQVSQEHCKSFIERLNEETGKRYRLPTEAEWEYAARGGNRSNGYIYAGSNDPDLVAWYDGNSSSRTHEVKEKDPNELELYDMNGNVGEWCADWYDRFFYSNSPRLDPTGPSSGSKVVVRGGSWNDVPMNCCISNRNDHSPISYDHRVGFRLSRDY